MIGKTFLSLALSCLVAGTASAQDRVITIGGAVTEIAVALGAAPRLIGRDTTSYYPQSVQALPDVGYVRALSAEGVLSLTPDMILAEDGAGPAEAVDVLRAGGIAFHTVPNTSSAAGVLEKIDAVAKALGLTEAGAKLHQQVADSLAAVAAKADAVEKKRRVLFIISLAGGKVNAAGAGTGAQGIIELAGAQNAVSGYHGYKQISDEAILDAQPDVILVMDREGDLAIRKADILAHPALSKTPAALNEEFIGMDGLLLLGFGPRTADAANALHDAIYGK